MYKKIYNTFKKHIYIYMYIYYNDQLCGLTFVHSESPCHQCV